MMESAKQISDTIERIKIQKALVYVNPRRVIYHLFLVTDTQNEFL